jgi:hypothetical protein
MIWYRLGRVPFGVRHGFGLHSSAVAAQELGAR